MLSKMAAGFGLVAIVVLAMGLVATHELQVLHHSVTTLEHEGIEGTDALLHMRGDLFEYMQLTNREAIAEDPAQVHELQLRREELGVELEDRFADILAGTYKLPAGATEAVGVAESSFESLVVGLAGIEELAASHQDAEVDALLNQVEPLSEQMLASIDHAVELREEANAELIAAAEATYDTAQNTMIAFLIAGVVLAVGLAVYLIRALTKSAGAVRSITGQLSTSATELGAVSTQMAAAAEESAAQATIVAAAAEQVSMSVSTVASAAEEMGATISELATNTVTATAATNDAAERAERSSVLVGELSDASQEIVKVVDLIASIANETNLLALNATIEAARAGDAGRGFAVVAAEVKDLAHETSTATGEISERIERVRTGAMTAAEAIEVIGRSVNDIRELQTTVSAAIEEQSAATAEIARSVNEVAQGSNEIASNITAVAAAASQTTGGAQQTSTSAQHLLTMAADLEAVTATLRF